MQRCLLASGDEGFERRLRAAMAGEVEVMRLPQGATLAELIDAARRDAPHVLLLGPDVELKAGLAVARRLDEERPDVGVVLVAELTVELWQQALRAGVRDVLAPQADAAVIRTTVRRAGEAAERFRARSARDTPATGKVIVVLSPKGGSGKTTVAANLATALAASGSGQVVAVDADLQFGDLSVAFHLTPEGTLTDAVGRADDPVALKALLTQRDDVYVMAAPPDPASGEEITGEQLARVVRTLAGAFEYTIIDTPAALPEQTLALIDLATDLVLVASMDVPSVRQLRKEVEALDVLGLTSSRRHLVLNRADSRVGLSIKDVEAVLGMPVAVAVPSTKAVPLSLNAGDPLVTAQPRTPAARQLRELAGRFVPVESPKRR